MEDNGLTFIRPVQLSDLDDLYSLAIDSGIGMTSLPKEKNLLLKKIHNSIISFDESIKNNQDYLFLFVLEDLSKKKIVGCSGITNVEQVNDPAYYFHVDYDKLTLSLTKHYQDAAELCSLFLEPEYRKNNNGKLLSRSRLIYLSQNKKFQNKQIIAEMRGFFINNYKSPFWDYFFKDKLKMTVKDAIHLRSIGRKQDIIDLIGSEPISILDAPEDVLANIGIVHEDTKAAITVLEKEGFVYNKYVDLIDAGPAIESEVNKLKTVTNVKNYKINNLTNNSQNIDKIKKYLISNNNTKNFRACVTNLYLDDQLVDITQDIAEVLQVKSKDDVKIVEL